MGQGAAGASKHFNKDGVQFDYPESWTLQDTSNGDAVQLTLALPDSPLQIRVFAYGKRLATPERVAEAHRVLVDPYIKSTEKQFEGMGVKPETTPATTDALGMKLEGVKIAATLDEPGAAEIYSGVINQRLVVLTFFGTDKGRKQSSTVWDRVRSSLQVEVPKTEVPTASPKPADKTKPR